MNQRNWLKYQAYLAREAVSLKEARAEGPTPGWVYVTEDRGEFLEVGESPGDEWAPWDIVIR